jgi:YbbR domain-containing protein
LNSRKLIQSIFENWPAKVLSIAVALILFVFYRMNTLATRPLTIPLTVQTDSELMPVNPYPQTVRIILRGEDDVIKSVADGDFSANADFSRYKTNGWYRAPVQIRKEGSALGVEPLEITVNPLEISVHLDRKITKTVPLVAGFQGRTASGFDLIDYSLSPREITVTGPLSVLDSVTEFQTETVELQGRSVDFNTVVNIINTNNLVSLRGNGTAELRGVIRPGIQVRTFDGLPVVIRGLDPKFDAVPSGITGNVRIEGNQSRLNSFTPPAGFLSVDCSGLTEPGIHTLPVLINLPDGLILIRQEPEEISLMITGNTETPVQGIKNEEGHE